MFWIRSFRKYHRCITLRSALKLSKILTSMQLQHYNAQLVQGGLRLSSEDRWTPVPLQLCKDKHVWMDGCFFSQLQTIRL